MESLLFLFSLIALAVIIHWSIVNDDVPLYGRTKGLLAMKDADYERLAQQPRPVRRGWYGSRAGGTTAAPPGPPPPESDRPPAG